MCDCYDKVLDGLFKKHSHPDAPLEKKDLQWTEGADIFMDLQKGTSEKALGVIQYRYRNTRISRSPKRVYVVRNSWIKGFIKPNYCPICGEKKEA